jgi:hypothetical protein
MTERQTKQRRNIRQRTPEKRTFGKEIIFVRGTNKVIAKGRDRNKKETLKSNCSQIVGSN